MSVSLRPWAYEDIFKIAELEKQCFRDPWNFRMLADAFFSENTLTVAAEEEGALVGYAFAVLAGEEADVANVAVAESCRRREIASEVRPFARASRYLPTEISVTIIAADSK